MDTKNPWREDMRAEGVLNYLPNGDLEFRGPSRESNSLESQQSSAHFSPIATLGAVGITRTLHVRCQIRRFLLFSLIDRVSERKGHNESTD